MKSKSAPRSAGPLPSTASAIDPFELAEASSTHKFAVRRVRRVELNSTDPCRHSRPLVEPREALLDTLPSTRRERHSPPSVRGSDWPERDEEDRTDHEIAVMPDPELIGGRGAELGTATFG